MGSLKVKSGYKSHGLGGPNKLYLVLARRRLLPNLVILGSPRVNATIVFRVRSTLMPYRLLKVLVGQEGRMNVK